MNRHDLAKKLGPVTSDLLREKGYISLVDVFVALGYLTNKDVEAWRRKQVPYLEKSIAANLGKISFISKTVISNCKKGKLKPSVAVYQSWGKGHKTDLRFSKSGLRKIEEAYSTHYIKPHELAKGADVPK